jgi:hypothetical protein
MLTLADLHTIISDRALTRMNAIRREGVDQFFGLPLYIIWGGLLLTLPLASEFAFCLSGYRRWKTRF